MERPEPKKFDANRFRPNPKPELKAKKDPVPLKRSAIKTKRKVTGEAALFETLWNTRSRVSFIDGSPLGNDAKTFFFAHVLPKGKYPEFRLFDKNIVLLTQEQHHQFDMCPRSEIAYDPAWKKLLLLEAELKKAYKEFKTRKPPF